jgi:hypothetical protein
MLPCSLDLVCCFGHVVLEMLAAARQAFRQWLSRDTAPQEPQATHHENNLVHKALVLRTGKAARRIIRRHQAPSPNVTVQACCTIIGPLPFTPVPELMQVWHLRKAPVDVNGIVALAGGGKVYGTVRVAGQLKVNPARLGRYVQKHCIKNAHTKFKHLELVYAIVLADHTPCNTPVAFHGGIGVADCTTEVSRQLTVHDTHHQRSRLGRPMSRSLSGALSSPTTIEDLFRWHFKVVQTLKKHIPDTDLKTTMLCDRLRVSTSFSGAGTIEIGMHHLKIAVASELGHTFEPTSVSACDINKFCQELLVRHAPHVFQDVMDRLPEKMHKSLGQSSPQDTMGTIARARLRTRSWCTVCNKLCQVPVSDFDMSGSPCTDWSMIGKRRKAAGPCLPLFLVWARYHVQVGTLGPHCPPSIVVSRVRQLPTQHCLF